MQAALKSDVITVEDYLAGEEASEVKRLSLKSIELVLPLSSVYEGVPLS